MDHSPSPSQSSVSGYEPSAGTKPLSHRELASGALYNAAQPHRHERRPVQAVSDEQLFHMESHYSVADIAAGHLFNPTSSLHEVDPPTWPSRGMENVPPGRSAFRTYRLERPRSPPLAKPRTVHQGKRPSHHTVASGALYNPYVQTRLPDHLQPAEELKVLQRSTSGNSSRLYAPSPRAPLHIPEARDPSEAPVSKNGSVKGENTFIFPGGNPRSSVHFTQGGTQYQSSIRSHRSAFGQYDQGAAGNSNAQSRERTISEDTMYYHPSREGSVRMVPAPGHEPSIHAAPGSARFSNVPSRVPTASGGSVHTARTQSPSTVLAHPAPWMQQETIAPGSFASVHPSRAQSPGSFIQHSRAASVRGPSSLHHATSVHLSRTPSTTAAHPSQVPTVIRDSIFHDEFVVHPDVPHGEAWGSGGQAWGQGQDDAWGSGNGGVEGERTLSRSSTVNSGGGQAWGHGQGDAWGAGVERPASAASTIRGGAGSIHSVHPSRTPSVARSHVSQLQDLNGSPVPPYIPSRAPSAAPSHASRFQAQNEIPLRAPSVAPSLVSRFQEQNAGATPRIPSRVPSMVSMRETSPMLVGSSLSRARTPSFKLPVQYDTLPEEDDPALWGPQDEQQPEVVRAMSPGAGSINGGQAPSVHATLRDPASSVHPSRPSSAARNDVASIRSLAPSAMGETAHIPSHAPSVMGIPSRAPSAAPTLTRRGKASRLGRGNGRTTPAMAGSDQENIRISVVQPTE